MKILGLIAEYNPFHNGHLYHLDKSKEVTGATHVVAVMSGNFLQRGEPAITNKWRRAKMAVESGVDLVIELPTVFACSTAEFFARGAISLFNNLNAVNCISFGSEAGDITLLSKIADILVSPSTRFSTILRDYIDSGFAFPVARSKAVTEYLKTVKHYSDAKLSLISNTMKNPNNILGIEYLKAIKHLDSPITPYTIGRKSSHYRDKTILADSTIASATAIRKNIFSNKPLSEIKNVLPNSTFDILLSDIDAGFAPVSGVDFEKPIFTILRRSNADDIKNIFDVVEGLENRIYRCCIKVDTLPRFYDCVKSKRYILTRLKRILTHVLLNINKEEVLCCNNTGPQYARILAFNTKGREILKTLNTSSAVPIITNLKYYRPQNKVAHKMLNIDIRATNIYSLAFKNKEAVRAPLDYTTKPYYIMNNQP